VDGNDGPRDRAGGDRGSLSPQGPARPPAGLPVLFPLPLELDALKWKRDTTYIISNVKPLSSGCRADVTVCFNAQYFAYTLAFIVRRV